MTPTDPARSRFFAITALRLSAALLISFGLVIAFGETGWTDPASGRVIGLAMAAVGAIDLLLFVPMLIRRWRSGG